MSENVIIILEKSRTCLTNPGNAGTISENVGELSETVAKYRKHIGTKSETRRNIFETIGKQVSENFGYCQKHVGKMSEYVGKRRKISEQFG